MRQSSVAATLAGLWISLAAYEVEFASATLAPALGMLAAVGVDGLARLRRERSLLASAPASAAWAAVLSVFLMTAVERLNQAQPVWTYLGWPRDELLRYLALGALHASALPLMIGVADLCGFFGAPSKPISLRVTLPMGTIGIALVAAALVEQLPLRPPTGFAIGLLGLLLVAEAWNGSAEAARVTRSPVGPIAAGAVWGALLWVGDLATARRFLIVDLASPAWLALCALLLGPAVLTAYQLTGRKLGLPVYPNDAPEEEAIRRLDLDR